MKIQNLEHLENHTSIFNNSVNMQIQIEKFNTKGGKKKKTTHEIHNYSRNCAKPNWKIQTLRKRKPNLKKMQI
jgi:hypothetical protein